MDKFEFATSLIRSPFWKRIGDRTFLQSVGTAVTAISGTVAIWQTKGVPVDQKVNVTIAALAAVSVVVSFWNASEKQKDTEIAKAVLAQAPVPQSVAVGALGASDPQSSPQGFVETRGDIYEDYDDIPDSGVDFRENQNIETVQED
jgi:hypothetical protein